VKEGKAPEDGAAGILWIAIAFGGTLALGRTFERERQSETLRALLMAPEAHVRPIYVGMSCCGIVGRCCLPAGELRPRRRWCVSSSGTAAVAPPMQKTPFCCERGALTGTNRFSRWEPVSAMLVRAPDRGRALPVPVVDPITRFRSCIASFGTAALLQPDCSMLALVRVLGRRCDCARRRI
jgi:hypothetical protein